MWRRRIRRQDLVQASQRQHTRRDDKTKKQTVRNPRDSQCQQARSNFTWDCMRWLCRSFLYKLADTLQSCYAANGLFAAFGDESVLPWRQHDRLYRTIGESDEEPSIDSQWQVR